MRVRDIDIFVNMDSMKFEECIIEPSPFAEAEAVNHLTNDISNLDSMLHMLTSSDETFSVSCNVSYFNDIISIELSQKDIKKIIKKIIKRNMKLKRKLLTNLMKTGGTK